MKSELLSGSKLNSRELGEGVDEGVDHAVVPPEAELERTAREVWDQADLDLLADGNLGHGDRLAVEVDPAIGVHGPLLSEAEVCFVKRNSTKKSSKFPHEPVGIFFLSFSAA